MGMTYGQRLKRERNLRLWSQERTVRELREVARQRTGECISLGVRTYRAWECDERKPHPQHQLLLEAVFGDNMYVEDDATEDDAQEQDDQATG
jgi:transcriptional regulator with XRE-family HTH domain